MLLQSVRVVGYFQYRELQLYLCLCGHVHDEATEGKWEDLPENFECPECGVGKEDYIEM